MEELSKPKIWLAQTRANFLFLAVVLVLIGLALANDHLNSLEGQFNIFNAVLLVLGTVVAHASVNLFNEYSDFKTGIDFDTKRNPFSGGSGMLTGGKTKPSSVLAVAYAALIFSISIGVYFIFTAHWSLIILVILGALATMFYTNFFAKLLLGELFAGLTLGTFVIIGVYIAMTATPQMLLTDVLPLSVIMVSIPPGILTALLLFLNEFPDLEADKKGGRFHLVILLGRKKSAYVYALGLLLTFAFIIITPLMGLTSYWLLLGLGTLPVAMKAIATTFKNYEDTPNLIPALGMNVLVVLITDLLLAIGIFVQ